MAFSASQNRLTLKDLQAKGGLSDKHIRMLEAVIDTMLSVSMTCAHVLWWDSASHARTHFHKIRSNGVTEVRRNSSISPHLAFPDLKRVGYLLSTR